MSNPNQVPPGAPLPVDVVASVPLQRFRVKRVLSGDSFIVQGVPQGGPPPEKQVNLAYLIAPKMARKGPGGDATGADQLPAEPWAWESREALRKLITGKDVTFRVEYKIMMGQAQREFGILYMGDKNVSEEMVSDGWAEVRQGKGDMSGDQAHFAELEETAKAEGKGRWSGSPPNREFISEVDDPVKLIGKTYKGVVDHVRDGSSFRVYLDVNGDGLRYQIIVLNLSGVKCPGSSEEFGDQAKYFSEVRILGRDVDIRLEQQSGGGNTSAFYGTLLVGKNNLAEHLLRQGMAKCVDWSMGMTQNSPVLRSAEREAKSSRLRLWKNYQPPAGNSNSEAFDAKVVEIVSADSVMVQNLSNNEVKKLFIASVRPPKLQDGAPPRDNKEKGSFRPLFDIPYMLDAREFLRSKLIGKRVRVKVDYVQAKTDQYPEKVGASITLADGTSEQNVGEMLVQRGLASVIRYRANDDQRASNYDLLLAAEDKALKGNKGMHSKKPFTPPRILDLSTDSTRAKGHLPFLTRPAGSRRDAIVEFVYSASRIKVWAQKDNCMLNLILAGVNAPKMNDPFGPEAMSFVKSLIHQRNVQIVVEAIDKVGNFIGWLYVPSEKGPEKNLAIELAKSGLASVRDSGASIISTLRGLESEAKGQKIGIWANYVEPVEPEGNGHAASDDEETDKGKKDETTEKAEDGTETKVNGTEKKKTDILTGDIDKRQKVVITQVSRDMSSVYAQLVDEGRRLEELLTEMRTEIEHNPPLPGSFHPEKGNLVASRFSQDGLWYRAKIEKVVGTNYAVLYVDYGNRETVPRSSLAPLPGVKFSTHPASARAMSLAFVSFPAGEPEMVQEAYRLFSGDVADVELGMKIEYRDANGLDAVTLVDVSSKMDLGYQLVADGLAVVDESRRDRRAREKLSEYLKAQETAMSKRLNLWQYGDFRTDDAREFGLPAPTS